MKKLFILTIVWLIGTVWLAYDNHKLKQFQDDNLGWRTFLVYSNTFLGCESGILFMIQRGSQTPDDSHEFCKLLSYHMELLYKEKWKNDNN